MKGTLCSGLKGLVLVVCLWLCVGMVTFAAGEQKVTVKKTKITDVSREDSTSLKISWKKVSNADGYLVFRSTSKNGEYEKLGNVKVYKKREFVDDTCKCGVKYYYKITAYRKVNGKIYYSGKCEAVSKRTTPPKTYLTDATSQKQTKVTLHWKKVSYAHGYEIYRKCGSDGKYKLVKKITSKTTLKWTDKGLNEDKTYYYKVRAYRKVGKTHVYGAYSSSYKKLSASDKLDQVQNYVGVSYCTGGTSTRGWDCSGFTQWAMDYVYDVEIPRTAAAQAGSGKKISKSDSSKWKPGDILLYSDYGGICHAALYLGDGKMMHALNSKYDTIIQDVDYYERWDGGTWLTCVRRYH